MYLGLAAREGDAEARNAPAVAQRGVEAAVQLAPQPHLISAAGAWEYVTDVWTGAVDDPASPCAMTALNRERVDFAGGGCNCLQADRGAMTTYDASAVSTNDSAELGDVPLGRRAVHGRVLTGRVAA